MQMTSMQIYPPLTRYVIPRYLIYTSRGDNKHPFPPLYVSFVSFSLGWQTDTFLLLPIYENHDNFTGRFTFAVTACNALRSRAGLQGFRSEIVKGKSQILVWNRVRVSGTLPHNPNLFFWKYPPGFFRVFDTQMGGHCARRSFRRPWKLGLRIVAWSKPRMFCEENLGKIKFRVFPKRVGPRILSLKSVDYFGTSEHCLVVEKK